MEINNYLKEKLKKNIEIINNTSDYYIDCKETINKNYITLIDYELDDDVAIFNNILFETEQAISWAIEAYVNHFNESVELSDMYEFSVIPGVGGNDTEDLSNTFFDLYLKYVRKHSEVFGVDEPKRLFFFKSTELFKKISISENCMYKVIRISPYCGKKQTSFVQICIKCVANNENFSIKEEDLYLEATKSSGPGGQHVNKTESAVRAKHKPTGIIVFISEHRSQQQNRKLAIEILTRKVSESIQAKKEINKKKVYKETWKISWGNSYSRIFNQHKQCYLKNRINNTVYNNVKNILEIDLDELILDQFLFLIKKD